MIYLLDTHTFLWFINDDPALSSNARLLIEASENIIFLSAASVWEIAIKVSLGRLEIPSPFADFINEQLRKSGINLLEIKTEHAGKVVTLPFHHRDPFDRLIIAQAISENIPIIGKDLVFESYGIECLW
jgi:PIN domain nuclease of toxin-antitoxin system